MTVVKSTETTIGSRPEQKPQGASLSSANFGPHFDRTAAQQDAALEAKMPRFEGQLRELQVKDSTPKKMTPGELRILALKALSGFPKEG